MDKLEIQEMTAAKSVPVYQEVSLQQAALPASALLLIGWALCYWLPVPFSWYGSAGSWSLLYGASLGVALYLLVFVASVKGPFDTSALRELSRMLNSLFKNLSWAGIVILSALAGIGEELLFRVLIQGFATQWLGPVFGILIAAILFGLAHYLSRLYVVLTFIIGVIFGVLYHATQSAALVMVMHFVYDVCAFAALVKFPHLLDLGNPEAPTTTP